MAHVPNTKIEAALAGDDDLIDLVSAALDATAGPELIATARAQYASDAIEIDDDAGTSEGDGGTWVQAWVWVPNQNAGLCAQCGNDLSSPSAAGAEDGVCGECIDEATE